MIRELRRLTQINEEKIIAAYKNCEKPCNLWTKNDPQITQIDAD